MTPRTKPDSCIGCDCYHQGTDFLQVTGNCSLGIGIVGEASGETEAREQRGFVEYAPAGSVLERTLRRLGYSRDQFFCANCIFCRPKDNWLDGAPWEFRAIQHCQPNLLTAIRRHRPKVLLALGNIPLRTLTGISGKQRGVGHLRGYVFRALPEFCEAAGNPDLLVLPTYHPSFLRRGAIHLTGVFARDIQRAVNIRRGTDRSYILDLPDFTDSNPEDATNAVEGWLQHNNLRYILHPTIDQLDAFCRDARERSDAWVALSPDEQRMSPLVLSYDLETYESGDLDEDARDGFTDTQIRLAQVSLQTGSGMAMPWGQEFVKAFRWLMKLPLPKIGHNREYFDDKVLRAVGQRDYGDAGYLTPVGPLHDTLMMFHYWQPDLPAHLQCAASYAGFPFAWKHLSGTNLEFYGVVDVDAALRVFWVARRTMIERGIWDDPVAGRNIAGYVNQVEAVRPVLAAMEERGLPINNERRLALGAEFDAAEKEALAELDARFPNEARRLHPKDGYKGVPPQVKKLLADGQVETDVSAVVFQDPPEKLDDGTEEPGATYRYEQRSFNVAAIDETGEPTTEPCVRWCRVYQFSPNSPAQLKRYMEVKGHKIPFSKKKGKETTDKKELERTADKHKDNFYLKVIECREMRKMSSTYVDGFKPHADGRVHTTFTFATATGQLSSRNPSTQTYPAHGRLGKAVKSMIEAPDGYEFANWDFKSYHVLMLGFLAEDPTYMRMARLDMHSFVTWHFLKLPGASQLHDQPDEELLEKFSWLKSNEKYKYVRDKQSKPSILGIGLGLMPPHLYEMNREHFESLAHAKKFRSVIEGLFPKVFQWQERITAEAHHSNLLRNPFGMIRWFYEVMAPDPKKGGLKPGEQYNAAMAFRVQSDSHGDLRERLKMLRRRGLDDKYGLCNTIHDSATLCYPCDLRDEMFTEIGDVLGSPSRALRHPVLAPEGLVIGVECSVGKRMSDLKVIVK